MALTTPYKITFTEDLDIRMDEMAIGGNPSKGFSKTIALGSGLFGRAIVEINTADNIFAFIDESDNDQYHIEFKTAKKRK